MSEGHFSNSSICLTLISFLRQLQHTLWLEREKFALLQIEEKKRREALIRRKQEEDEVRIQYFIKRRYDNIASS